MGRITTQELLDELNRQIDVCQSRNESYDKTSWNEDDMIGVLITQNQAMEIVYRLERIKEIEEAV